MCIPDQIRRLWLVFGLGGLFILSIAYCMPLLAEFLSSILSSVGVQSETASRLSSLSPNILEGNNRLAYTLGVLTSAVNLWLWTLTAQLFLSRATLTSSGPNRTRSVGLLLIMISIKIPLVFGGILFFLYYARSFAAAFLLGFTAFLFAGILLALLIGIKPKSVQGVG